MMSDEDQIRKETDAATEGWTASERDFRISECQEFAFALREECPIRCDFCQQYRPPGELHPEEGGEWACIHCIERWDKEDAAKAPPG